MENITFECPGCGQILETTADVAGQVVKCPSCELEFEVPALEGDALETESPEESALESSAPNDDAYLLNKLAPGVGDSSPAPKEPVPQDDLLSKLAGSGPAPQRKRPGGEWGPSPAAVIPPVADEEGDEDQGDNEEGGSLAVPQEHVPSKPKLGLRVRTEEEENILSSVPSTGDGGMFQQPVYTGPTWHLPRWVKLTMSSVLSFVFVFMTMCFVPFGDSRVIKLWMAAEEALQNPRGRDGVKTLEEAIRGIAINDKNRDDKIGLMAAYGLAIIMAGDVADGQTVCRYIEGKYKNSSYAGLVAQKSIMEQCRSCKKRVPEKCPVCKGNSKCLSCDGAGFKRRGRLSGSSGGLGNGFRRAIGKQKASLSKAPEEAVGVDEDAQKCVSCDGTGVCPYCKGSGRKPFFCEECKNELEVLSVNKVKNQHAQVVEKMAEPLRKKNRIGKILLTIQAMKFHIGSKPSPPADTIDATESAILFSRTKQEDPEDYIRPPEKVFVYDDSSLSVADALIALSMLQSQRRALDPEALRLVVDKSIKVEDMKELSDPDRFKKFLDDHGLVMKTAPLTDKIKIPLITTVSSWAYSLAVMYMTQASYEKAYAQVESVADDKTEFGAACVVLKDLLEMMGKDDREIKKLGKESEYRASRIKVAINEEKKEAAMKEGAGVIVGLVEYTRNVAGTRSAISRRFEEACKMGLTSEARGLLGYLISERKKIQTAAETVKAFGVGTETLIVPEIPGSVTELYQILDGLYATAEGLIKECEELLVSDVPKVSRNYAKAYYLDRASLPAKVGMGYGIVANHSQLFTSPQNLVLASPAPRSKLQTLPEGLALGLGCEGPVRVGISSSAGAKPVESGGKYGYWTLLGFHDLTSDIPFPFVALSDDSRKYPFSIMSGRQAYQWLMVNYESKIKAKGFMMSYKSGSPAGASDCFALPVALASVSTYDKKKYRDDVVCAGGLQPDGVLLRVRGASAKVRSISDSKEFGIMVLPSANKADLAALTIDDLCKCIIITAENVSECMNCCNDVNYKKDVIATLAEAQKLILNGELYEAKKKLVSIGLNSDIYNIGRLLELLTVADL